MIIAAEEVGGLVKRVHGRGIDLEVRKSFHKVSQMIIPNCHQAGMGQRWEEQGRWASTSNRQQEAFSLPSVCLHVTTGHLVEFFFTANYFSDDFAGVSRAKSSRGFSRRHVSGTMRRALLCLCLLVQPALSFGGGFTVPGAEETDTVPATYITQAECSRQWGDWNSNPGLMLCLCIQPGIKITWFFLTFKSLYFILIPYTESEIT